eukprot:1442176-Amphidinium_carterae.1
MLADSVALIGEVCSPVGFFAQFQTPRTQSSLSMEQCDKRADFDHSLSEDVGKSKATLINSQVGGCTTVRA